MIAKAILKKNDKAGGINFLDFRQHYKSTLIKTTWYSTNTKYKIQIQKQTYRTTEQSPGINPHTTAS